MKKVIHNKLVRDRIPEIIEAQDRKPKVVVLGDNRYAEELLKKLCEEATETLGALGDPAKIIEELGDVYEVIDAIIDHYQLDKTEIMKAQSEKRATRGGFKGRLFLKHVLSDEAE